MMDRFMRAFDIGCLILALPIFLVAWVFVELTGGNDG